MSFQSTMNSWEQKLFAPAKRLIVLLSAKLTTERIIKEIGQYNEQRNKQPAPLLMEA
jgi:hypothetical protein